MKENRFIHQKKKNSGSWIELKSASRNLGF